MIVNQQTAAQKKVDELYAVKQEVQQAICKVNDEVLRELLDRRYIKGERFEKIACSLRKPKDGKEYSYRHVVMELHPKALKEIENILSAYH